MKSQKQPVFLPFGREKVDQFATDITSAPQAHNFSSIPIGRPTGSTQKMGEPRYNQ
jgi:hypothetical protein